MIDEMDYWMASHIVCPYCGYRDDDCDGVIRNDGDSTEWECGECEKTFKVTTYINVNYTSEPIQGGE